MQQSKPIGLVLSGGGSKGIAHAGVLQFLNNKTFIQRKFLDQVLDP